MKPSFLDLVKIWAEEEGFEVEGQDVVSMQTGRGLDFFLKKKWRGLLFTTADPNLFWLWFGFGERNRRHSLLNSSDPEVLSKLKTLLSEG